MNKIVVYRKEYRYNDYIYFLLYKNEVPYYINSAHPFEMFDLFVYNYKLLLSKKLVNKFKLIGISNCHTFSNVEQLTYEEYVDFFMKATANSEGGLLIDILQLVIFNWDEEK